MKALAVVMVMASTTHAETAEQLTEQARELARAGRCDQLPAIGRRVDVLDDDYYTRVYSLDPVIAGCKQADERSPQPSAPAPMSEPTGEPKSPAVALGLSLGITAGGVGLLLAGYAHDSEPMMVLGGAATFIGPFYEIGTATNAADDYNRWHGFTAKVVPTGNGVALVGLF